ncbi:pyridoxal phosphate-dependent aminotransferase [Chroococcidiopsis sp. CCNUC1]|jgi:aspartate aminotransferase|uniref:pyridoxal phosphate-dependent aminotransferase n=1 Tax=Chroococcidiopsis sp. CCNUC1 TaxID=2653189 RepID=UPI000D0694FD|nr:pyridoxal phosphate-dependent aminotransferase [Chroococcidiopsis sp. CCNUC1]PSB49006.1 aspartate aminotransferase [Cyanosarcina cf. burmensis CCALA 770]URD47689.1 pyridoxal phosphate-dependent aminotransferase [Chroococcidiopsis sp. CCNUC1]
MNFAERMSRLGTESAFEVLAKAQRLEAQGRNIIHLEIGQPDFQTPMNICQAAFQAMKDGYTGYAPAAGLPQLRQAIAQYVTHTRGVEVHPDEVVVTPGAKPIIFFTILALVDTGDEVIYPNPGFPVYESVINFVGGKAIPLALREEVGFRFRIEDLEQAISPRTRLLILNSPQNPTGGVLQLEDLEAIANLAERHNFYILSDEIYSRILYEQTHHSIMSLPGMKERTILLDGYSKTYAMTGWRLGYGVAPQLLAQKLEQLTINSNSCTCSFTQIAGIEALTGTQEFVEQMVDEFRQRRDFIVDGLNAIAGIECVKPTGAFYVFPNVKQLPLSCDALADYLLAEAGVAVLSGSAFGRFGEGYLRLSYANSLANIREALDRIQTAIAQLK